ncbi:major facilitator superfamily domain-containing protein 10 isoform X4 [Odocoileus virginianus]|uniref:Major facilitator superfamily domain-containing protein 10 isoform X4 n=1 Tax=Odocoileus virginianus TaxID=9874 RepID=A0ABM4HT25_ODOVR
MGCGAGGSCTPRPPIRPPAPETRVVAVVFLGLLLDLLAFTMLLPLLPGLLESHGRAHDPLYGSWQRGVDWFAAAIGMPAEKRYNSVLFGGLIGSVFSLLQFLSAPLTGAVSDCLGRRPGMLLSLAGVATSYAVWAASKSFAAFLASRVIGGISKGNVSLCTAIVADLGSPSARSKGMSSGWLFLWASPWAPHWAPSCPRRQCPGWPCSSPSRTCCSSGASCQRRCPRRSGAWQPARPGPGLLPLPLPVLGPGVHAQLPGAPALPVQQGRTGEDVFLHRSHHGHYPGRLRPADPPWQGDRGCEAGHPAARPCLAPCRLGTHTSPAGPGAAALRLGLAPAEGHGHGHAAESGRPGQGRGPRGGRLSVLAGRCPRLLHRVRCALPAPILRPADPEPPSADTQGRVAGPPLAVV